MGVFGPQDGFPFNALNYIMRPSSVSNVMHHAHGASYEFFLPKKGTYLLTSASKRPNDPLQRGPDHNIDCGNRLQAALNFYSTGRVLANELITSVCKLFFLPHCIYYSSRQERSDQFYDLAAIVD